MIRARVLALAVLATSLPAPADSAEKVLRLALQTVIPLAGKFDLRVELCGPTLDPCLSGSDALNASRAMGPVLGYELRVSQLVGIETSIGWSDHRIESGSTEFGTLTMVPWMFGPNFHYVQPQLDFYFGPRLGYVFYGDLETTDGRRVHSGNRTAIGAILGFDIPVGKTPWMITTTLQALAARTASGLSIHPLVLSVGTAFRF